ncbi:MAG: hypothetical protein ACKVVT_00010 [Dehalococcoidia bacterium]
MDLADSEALFWELAQAMLAHAGVTRSTMMGLPCLRLEGAFFASFDRRTGMLVVKLPEARVDAMVEAGEADAFAPAGRRFREWAAIPAGDRVAWESALASAFEHAASAQPPSPASKSRGRRSAS